MLKNLFCFVLVLKASGTLGDSWKTLNSAQSGSNAGGGGGGTIKRIKGAVSSKESVASAAAAAASGLTGSSSSGLGGGGGGPPNARKMYEEAQMVRRVKAYINKMPVIFDDDELQKLAQKCEVRSLRHTTQPPPQG